MNRAKAVTSWLLLLVLGYLVNVEASWGQEQLGSRKTLTHYLFAAVAAICIVIHLKERQRTVADLTPTTNWNASLVQVALTRSKTLIVRFFAMFYAIVRRPRTFFLEMRDQSVAKALTFLLMCAALNSAVDMVGHSNTISSLWQATLDDSGTFLSSALVTAIVLWMTWWIVRATVPFMRIFAMQAYFCSAAQLVIWWAVSGVEWCLKTYWPAFNPPVQISSLPQIYSHLPSVLECTDTDSFSTCLRQNGVSAPPAAIMAAFAVALFVTLGYFLLWIVSVLPALRQSARVGRIRAAIVASLFFVFFTAACSARVLIEWTHPKPDCGFHDVTIYPVLNPGPLKWTDSVTCGDFALIDVGNHLKSRWSLSQANHNAGLVANPGDQLTVRVFVENGAADNADPVTAVAKNVKIACQLVSLSATRHIFSATVTSDNARPISSSDIGFGGDYRVNTLTPTTLEYVAGSTFLMVGEETARSRRWNYALVPGTCDKCGRWANVNIPDGVLGKGVMLGDLPPGYQESVQLFFSVNVSPGDRASSPKTKSE